MEKSGFFTKVWKFWKHLCNASDNHRIVKHNQKTLWQDFYKFERDEGSFEISLCVCSIRVFAKFSGDPYYEPLAWFMINKNILGTTVKKLLYDLY